MEISDNRTTELIWDDAGSTYELYCSPMKVNHSKPFSLKSEPSATFALFMSYIKTSRLKMGVVSKSIDEYKPVDLRVKFWICDENGSKLYVHIAENFTFSSNEQRCEFASMPGVERDFLKNAFVDKTSITFGCELTVLDSVSAHLSIFKDSLIQSLWNAYQNERDFDAIILAGGKEFKVSRIILNSHSEVLRNLLLANFKEGAITKVKITGITAPAMEAFIKWMYTGEISSNDIVEELFAAATTCMIPNLKMICAKLMIESLSEKNVAHRLVLSVRHNDKELEQNVLKFIEEKGMLFMVEVMKSSAWCDYLNLQRNATT